MSRIKNLSRAGWMVVGIVVTLILVPTGVAFALSYTGLQGSSGHKANVSVAGQLLTTEALPSAYRDYQEEEETADGESGGSVCTTVTTIPSGDAFIVQDVMADVYGANAPVSVSSPNGSESVSGFNVYADTANQGCGNGDVVTTGEAPGGTVGNVNIPIAPGYVIPSGYNVDLLAIGIDAVCYVSGYLVPSADAPRSPTNGTTTRFVRLHR